MISSDGSDLADNATAAILKGGELSAQETKVFQTAVMPGQAVKVTLVQSSRRRGTSSDLSELQLMMKMGAASDLDDFTLHSRSGASNGDPQLEVGNCGSSTQATPIFIGVKNDGWYGAADYLVNLSTVDCSSCTGIRCPENMACVESGKYVFAQRRFQDAMRYLDERSCDTGANVKMDSCCSPENAFGSKMSSPICQCASASVAKQPRRMVSVLT